MALTEQPSPALSQGIIQGANRIFQEALACDTEEALGSVCLGVAEELTQSRFGFIGLVDAQGLFCDIAISDPGWETCRMDEATGHRKLPTSLEMHGIYGRVLRDGKGFYTNDPAMHPDRIGLPPGHPPLHAFLGVPLRYDARVVGMVGVANRPGGYCEKELVALDTLAIAIVQAIKHKQTEVALRQSEERFRALFESTSVAMTMADPASGRLLAVNDTYRNMLGYTQADLNGKTFSDLTHPEDRVADWAGYSCMVRGERPSHSVEKRLLHKDGHSVWCLVTTNIVRDAAGQAIRSVAVINDISGRRQMEEELQRAHLATVREQNLLKAVFEALPVGICITDERGGILRTNHMDEQIWGVRPATTGIEDYHEYKAWWENTGTPVEPEEWASARAVKNGETVIGQILEIQRGDGEHRIINNSAAPVFSDDGKIVGSAVSIQDVTRLWETAKELNNAKLAAEEASRAKSDFIVNMSHEIRTPLAVFRGVIEEMIRIDRIPEHQELLALAKKSSQHLYTLVNEILDLSKIEARRMEIVAELFNLRDCMQETVALMAARAQEKNLSLALDIAPAVPEQIVGDPFRLDQILINLIGNAIKFTDAGEVKIAVGNDGGALSFTVSDTGIGIPEDKQELIFQTFSQVDSSSTRRHAGTGLGLAISKGLVELMGGKIDVCSQVGQGSRFTFTLPLKNDTEPPATSSVKMNRPPPITLPTTAQILLAEDNPMIRSVFMLALSRKPWQTTTADSGQDAVQKWQAGKFDLILMDLQMPGMDGLQATREIRRQEASTGKRISIIGVTAQADASVHRECLDAGMNAILVKPFENTTLYATVERLLMS
jgi:PAS domain S-box-containing protein